MLKIGLDYQSVSECIKDVKDVNDDEISEIFMEKTFIPLVNLSY
jgi:hypothetical protein